MTLRISRRRAPLTAKPISAKISMFSISANLSRNCKRGHALRDLVVDLHGAAGLARRAGLDALRPGEVQVAVRRHLEEVVRGLRPAEVPRDPVDRTAAVFVSGHVPPP